MKPRRSAGRFIIRAMTARLPEDKDGLRRRYRRLARSFSAEEAAQSDARILGRLVSMPEYRAASSVFTYVGVFPEPDTTAFIRRALSDGKRVSVPFCPGDRDGFMVPKRIGGPEDLEPAGRFRIPAPKSALPELSPGEIDFAVVPGVAFGDAGQRLGRGGGFYDRFLTGFSGFSVGLCRACAFGAPVPELAHDRRVLAVVTELGVYRFGACPG